MSNERDRQVVIRFIMDRLRRAAAASVMLVLFVVPAAARANQPLVTHRILRPLSNSSNARITVRARAQAMVAKRVRFAPVKAARVLSIDQIVRVPPRARDGIGLRGPPR